MESRKAKLIVNKSGGTAGKGGVTFRVTLPTNWVRSIALDEENRNVKLELSGNSITISKDREKFEMLQKEIHDRIKIIKTASVTGIELHLWVTPIYSTYNGNFEGLKTFLGEIDVNQNTEDGNYILLKNELINDEELIKQRIQKELCKCEEIDVFGEENIPCCECYTVEEVELQYEKFIVESIEKRKREILEIINKEDKKQ